MISIDLYEYNEENCSVPQAYISGECNLLIRQRQVEIIMFLFIKAMKTYKCFNN